MKPRANKQINKQTILSYYDSFIPILALLAFFWPFHLKTNDNNTYIVWVIEQNKNMKGCHWH